MTIAPITTDRLLLRPYYAGMVTDDHVRWLNDPEVVRFSEQRHKVHTIESIHQYVNDIACDPNSYLWGIYLAKWHEEKPDGRLVCPLLGTFTAHIDRPNGVANLGILIGERAFWGKGLGSDAWNAVCNWLFDKQDIRKIEMGCHYENRAMRNLAKPAA